jgi:hypothetical protein
MVTQTSIGLPDRSRRLGKMAAASLGMSLSAYLDKLLLADCAKRGITLPEDQEKESKDEQPDP